MACCRTWGPATLLLVATTSQILQLQHALRSRQITNCTSHQGDRGADGGVRAEGSGKAVGEAATEKVAKHRRRGYFHQDKDAAAFASAPGSTSESEEEDDLVVILKDHSDVIGPSWRAFESRHSKRSKLPPTLHPSDGPKVADLEKLQSLDPVDEKGVSHKRYRGKVKITSDGRFCFIDCQEILDRFQRDVFVPPPIFSNCLLGATVTFRVFLVRGQPQACEIQPAPPPSSAQQEADLSDKDRRQINELIKDPNDSFGSHFSDMHPVNFPNREKKVDGNDAVMKPSMLSRVELVSAV